ncbi:pseudaminic acid biosynthesis-associated methylase [Crateriforma spongiae]|uniref:pseudaminic acid biosynthesis-associated methylase n=1 Tax=Crateriforma spongiae TaxID=2724528 RepID=UPI0039B11D20
MTNFKTDQEAFWAGDFGTQYISRNQSAQQIANNTAVFADILARTRDVKSVIEFGPNVGMNLYALRHLIPDADLSAVEINPDAAAQIRESGTLDVTVHETSILEFEPPQKYDLAFTKGVLIHINPDELPRVYDLLHQSSSRYILVAEYYNPSPVEIPYRGHDGKLFKRDFAGEILDRFNDVKLIDYRFVYHRDNNFMHDDVTWFLLEKRG